jgi:hypothetical protein
MEAQVFGEAAGLEQEAGRFRAALGILLVLVAGALLLVWSSNLLYDPDSWWHIKLGSDILATGTFPTVETYSYTFAGKPFIAKEWLSQIILALTFKAGGWPAVAFLTICCACLTVWLVYDALAAVLRPHLAATITMAAVFLTSPTFLARPHMLALPIAVFWTVRLFRAAEARQAPSFWLLALMVLWANLHGSFTLGFVIAGLAFLHLVQEVRLGNRPLLARWLMFLALCPAAALVHAYGWQALWISVNMAGGNEAMRYIDEWQPFSAPDKRVHEAALLVLIGGLLWLRLRLSIAKLAFIALALHMFLTYVRLVHVPFLLLPLVIAPEIARQHPGLSLGTWLAQQRDRLESTLARHFRHSLAGAGAAALAAAVIFIGFIPVKPPEKTAAAGALAYVEKAGITGNVLNSYNFGGSLIFHGRKTFIDGRAEQLFLDGFISEVNESMKPDGVQVLRDILKRYAITWTLLTPDDARNAMLATMAGWRKAYEDKDAVVYRQD